MFSFTMPDKVLNAVCVKCNCVIFMGPCSWTCRKGEMAGQVFHSRVTYVKLVWNLVCGLFKKRMFLHSDRTGINAGGKQSIQVKVHWIQQ